MRHPHFYQLIAATIVSSISVLTIVSEAQAATIYNISFSARTTGGTGGPYNVNGSFTWDDSVTGASNNAADVAWNDPGISDFVVSFTGGRRPFTFTENNIFGPRDWSMSPGLLSDATFDLTGSELVLNQNSQFINSNGQGYLCLGTNGNYCNSNNIYAFVLVSKPDNNIGFTGGYSAPGYFGNQFTPTVSTIEKISTVPEPLTILGAATAISFGAFFKKKLTKLLSI